jgi:hypothetical protein
VVGSDGKLSSTAKVTAGAVTENSTTKKKTAKSAKAAPKRRR